MGRSTVGRLLQSSLAHLALAAALCTRTARAEDRDRDSQCPRLADVVAGLGEILATRPGDARTTEIALHDHGVTWDIEVRGHLSTYSDPARDCTERGRVATVFAALVLEPLDADRPGGELSIGADREPSPHRALHYTLEVAPMLNLAVGAQGGNAPLGFGGQGRATVSGELLGLSVGAEGAVFSDLSLGRYGASIVRAAIDLSGRLSWGPDRLGLATDFGPYLAFLRVQGAGLLESTSSTHVDVGARFALVTRPFGRRIGPFLALEAELGARPFDLTVDPSGFIGTVPRLWLGIALGGALDL
jgi:hypothetical protein